MNGTYWVYLMASHSKTLYCGVTNDLCRRVFEHKHSGPVHFTGRYKVHKLVWFETFSSPEAAIRREKEIKGWMRYRKVDLILAANPSWQDLTSALL